MTFTVHVPFGRFVFKNAKQEHMRYLQSQFLTKKYSVKEKFTIETVFKKVQPKNLRSLESTYFADEKLLYIADTQGRLAGLDLTSLSQNLFKIVCDPHFDLYYLYSFIIEPLFIIKAASLGVLFLHASGVVSPKREGIVFTAWRHTGKTDSILHLTQQDFSFLGDDYCVLYKNVVYLYPKNINIFSYNLLRFPKLFTSLPFLTQQRLRLTLVIKKCLERLSIAFSGPLGKVFYRVAQLAEVSTNIKIDPEQLGIAVATEAPLTRLISLEKRKRPSIITANIKKQELQKKMAAVLIYELADFFHYYTAFSYFFPKKKVLSIERYLHTVSRLVMQYSKKAMTYYLDDQSLVDARKLGI